MLIGLLLSVVPLIRWMPGLLFDGNDVERSASFLERSLDIVIGIEFIKMLAKHSPGSSLEVLLYAIARHMVVGHESAMENLLSVGAIALIFIVRKFFFVPAFGAHLPGRPPRTGPFPSQSGIPVRGFASRLRKHRIMTTPTRSLKSPSKTPSTRTTPTRCWKQTRNEPDNVKCPAGRSSRAACGAFFSA
ncbi:MAG: hypothetical protein ACLVJH_01225 [Faecalibacterium prausnitzii]